MWEFTLDVADGLAEAGFLPKGPACPEACRRRVAPGLVGSVPRDVPLLTRVVLVLREVGRPTLAERDGLGPRPGRENGVELLRWIT